MVDIGFMPAVKRLLDATTGDRQTVLFSATLDRQVDKVLANQYQREPATASSPTRSSPARATHLFWSTSTATSGSRSRPRSSGAAADDRVHPHQRGADRVAKQLGQRSASTPRRSTATAARPSASVRSRVPRRPRHRPRGDRRRGTRHPRRRRRLGRPLRPAGSRLRLPAPLGPHGPRRRLRHRDDVRRVRQAPRRSRSAARLGRTELVTAPDIALIPELPPVEVLPERATLAPQPNAKPKRFEQHSGGPRRQHRTGDARTGGPRRFEDRPRRGNGGNGGSYGRRPNASRSGSNG